MEIETRIITCCNSLSCKNFLVFYGDIEDDIFVDDRNNARRVFMNRITAEIGKRYKNKIYSNFAVHFLKCEDNNPMTAPSVANLKALIEMISELNPIIVLSNGYGESRLARTIEAYYDIEYIF